MTDQVEQNKGKSLPDNRDSRAAMLQRLGLLADKMLAIGASVEKPVADMTRIELAIHHKEVTAEQVAELQARLAYVNSRWASLSFAELEPVADQITYKQYELARKLGLMTSEPMYGYLCSEPETVTEEVEVSSDVAIAISSELAREARLEAKLDTLETVVRQLVATGLILATGYYLAKLVEVLL